MQAFYSQEKRTHHSNVKAFTSSRYVEKEKNPPLSLPNICVSKHTQINSSAGEQDCCRTGECIEDDCGRVGISFV